jgi:hypothetical protein
MVTFVWSLIWVIISYFFVGGPDKLQMWASIISLIFSVYALVTLLYYYPQRDKLLGLYFMSSITLIIIFLLDLAFLIELLRESNYYDVFVQPQDHMIKPEYKYTFKEVCLLFIMGIVAILSLLVVTISSWRLKAAIDGKFKIMILPHLKAYESFFNQI